eukprot:CAMPEP_0180276514 /NCGR_PEP_ID=MMETSP0988-20121125/6416_1 /TAXON_ID=697907 /ORGANISM="non described non described, Strain CCMP2293" /LENGTH=140 /DNA_ID=CAMNT_0022247851 /DNA_START=73 /DNA_END=496 /DNA_ORIENTATION=-
MTARGWESAGAQAPGVASILARFLREPKARPGHRFALFLGLIQIFVQGCRSLAREEKPFVRSLPPQLGRVQRRVSRWRGSLRLQVALARLRIVRTPAPHRVLAELHHIFKHPERHHGPQLPIPHEKSLREIRSGLVEPEY